MTAFSVDNTRPRAKAGYLLVQILTALAALTIILPLTYVLIVSVSNQAEVNKNLLSFLHNPQFGNYAEAWTQGKLLTYGYNTVIVCATTVLLVLFSGSIFAYSLKIYGSFKELNFLYYVILAGIFIPIQAIIMPLFSLLKTFKLLNNLFSLGLVYAGVNLPLSMMLFAGFYKTIPKDIIEAASIDGCGPLRTFVRIVLPLTKTIISTVTILTSLNVWRDIFIPMMLTTKVAKRTISYGLMSFVSEFSLDWTTMCAAMVISTLPIIVLFLVLQKYFIGGVVAGAVKG